MPSIKCLPVILFLIPALFFAAWSVSLAEDKDEPSKQETKDLPFIRGDVDGNGVFNAIPDAIYALDYGFRLGPEPSCLEAADTDDDGVFNALTDVLYLLHAAFRLGPPPPAPFPNCGFDPNPGRGLGCDAARCP